MNKKVIQNMNKKVILVETVAMLRLRYVKNHELHLQGPLTGPLNWFQRLLYWLLGYEYIRGADYIDLMRGRYTQEGLCGSCLHSALTPPKDGLPGVAYCTENCDMPFVKAAGICRRFYAIEP
jgi:hypothetical protein